MNQRSRFLVGALFFALCISPASAQRSGDQGVGVMIGNPSGFSYKMFVNERVGVDAAFGVAQGELDAHVTLLFHDFNLLRQSPSFNGMTSRGDAPVYFGIGPRLLFEDDDNEFGIRLPLGLSYFPNQTPWETFAEIAPVIRFTPESGMDFDFALGVRYYFPAIRPRTN